MRHGHAARIGPSKLLHATSFLVLSCGLTACDPPWSASIGTEAASLAKAGAPVASKDADAAPAVAADFGTKGDEPAVEPTPIPADVELTPMENAGDPAGNARLAVRYRNAEELGDVVYFALDEKREYALKRDEKEPDKYAAMIDFDFDQFSKEQEQRRADIADAKLEAFDAFDGRAWVGEEKFAFLDPAEVRVARDKSLPLRIRPNVIMPPVLPSFDPGKTLMITDLSVVRDPTRTFDVCGNYGNPNGAWTFKTLMTNMANSSATGVDPAVFVENWLQTWNTNATINGYPVPARTKINTKVLNAWPRIAGKLDLDQAPMRLLAIVNRLDLRNGSMSASPYGGGSARTVDAGEGRFVFGVVDRNANGGCSKMDFTVILEYRVPIRQCPAVRSYAQQWGALTGLALGSPAYNGALQAITSQFTNAGVAPGRPNGSAISQIRTNEISLANTGYGGGSPQAARTASLSADLAEAIAIPPIGSGDPWELREFNLQADNQLHLVTTKKTPHHTFRNTTALASFINSNTLAILNGTYNVTPSWVTGSTFNFSVADSGVWNASGIVDPEARHRYSLGTCDACHGGETRYNGNPSVSFPLGSTPETSFVHVAPRLPNVASDLSKFLTGTGTLSLPSTFPKNDPIQPWAVPTRNFGDLLRRKTDLASLTVASCSATAVLQEALFQPVLDTH